MSTTFTARPNYSFNVVSTGNDHRFIYKKAKLGLRTALPLLWPAFPISIYLSIQGISAGFSISSFLFTATTYTIGIVVALMLLLNLFRTGGSFTVAQDGIVLNGTNYPYKSINSFYIKTPKGGRSYIISHQGNAGFGVHGAMQGLGNATTAIGAEAREALLASVRNKSYKVCMLFGEREKTLAGGLTDKTAKVMLNKIDELI